MKKKKLKTYDNPEDISGLIRLNIDIMTKALNDKEEISELQSKILCKTTSNVIRLINSKLEAIKLLKNVCNDPSEKIERLIKFNY